MSMWYSYYGHRQISLFLWICIFIFTLFVGVTQSYATAFDYNKLFPNTRILTQQPVHFLEKDSEEYVVTGVSLLKNQISSNPEKMVSVISYNKKTNQWVQVYKEVNPYWNPKVEVCNLLNNNLDQIIISDVQGSGAFLSYKILARVNNQNQIILNRKSIFQGSYRADGREIIEKTGHQSMIIQWNGKFFNEHKTNEEVVQPISAKDIQIQYTISYNHQVSISQSQITLHVGQKLQLRRMNTGGVERVLYQANKAIDFGRDYIVGIAPGNATITIVPDGYDWENAVKIHVIIVL